MAIFDDIYVPDDFLAVLGVEGGAFQTQSLPFPYLNRYRIAVDGRLEERKGENEEWSVVDFHGDVTFYRIGNNGWEEYVARFTEGKLTWIRRKQAAQSGGEE